MILKKRWICLLCCICSMGLPYIHSADELDIHVYFNNTIINSNKYSHDYIGKQKIVVQSMQEDITKVNMTVLQKDVLLDIPYTIDEQQQSIQFELGEGQDYDICIQIINENHQEKLQFTNINIYEKLPIFINDHPFENVYETDEDIHFTLEPLSFIDMNASYILINQEKMQWKKTEENYVFKIAKEGKYQLEFHFFDMLDQEIIQSMDLIKEYENKSIQLKLDAPSFSNQTHDYYHKDVTMDFHMDIIDITKLNIFVNHQLQNMEWEPLSSGYHSTLTIEEEGEYEFQFYYEDELLSSSLKHMIVLDKTMPVILDNTDYYDHQPVKEALDIQFQIQEDNLDIEHSNIILEKDGNVIETAKWKDKKYSSSLQEDGSYRYKIHAYDLAGNQVSYESAVITIDTTAPQIVLRNSSFLQNTNQDVLIDFQIFDKSLQAFTLYMKKNGKQMEVISGQDNFMDTFVFHEDTGTNSYELQAWAMDAAGNETWSEPILFVIDKEAPILSCLLQNKPYNGFLLTNESVSMLLSWQDAFLDKKKVSIYKNAEYMGEQEITDEASFYKSITALHSHQDQYQYIFTITDIAGNQREASIDFMIDTYLPDLHIKNDLFKGKARNVSWQPLLEENEKELTIIDVQLLKDQREIIYQWGDVIEEGGIYQLQVFAKDKAGNLAGLKQPFVFEIDKTPPVIQLLDKENGNEAVQRYEKNNISLKADTGFMHRDVITSIKINGREQLTSKLLEYEFALTQPGIYEIEITAVDEADNSNTKEFIIQLDPPEKKHSISLFSFIFPFAVMLCKILLDVKKLCRY